MTKRNQYYPTVVVVFTIFFGAEGGLIIGIAPTFAFATPSSSSIDQGATSMHLDEAIKALETGDTAGAETHMTEADKVLQEGAAKTHLDEAIKALETGDTVGAEMHAQIAQDSLQ